MSDASMAEGSPMMQSPRSNDGMPAASGPNVAALGAALEAPVEFTDLKARPSSLSPSLSAILNNHAALSGTVKSCCCAVFVLAALGVSIEFLGPRLAHSTIRSLQTNLLASMNGAQQYAGHIILTFLQDAVGNRVTLKLKDGSSWRIALPFAPTHLLPKLALDVLSKALEPSVWHALLSDHLICPGRGSLHTGRIA